jgi:hypothetical protein
MAYQTIFQDMLVQDETSFGASIAPAHRLHIRSTSLDITREKQHIEDTSSFVRGRDRMSLMKDTVEGDITGFGSPRNLHYALEWVNGCKGVSSAGSSVSCVRTYPQNVNQTWLTRTVNLDRNNSQELFTGVAAQSLELSCSDNLLEWSLGCVGRNRAGGVSMASVIGETVGAFSYADFNIRIHAGSTFGTQGVSLAVSDWSVNYNNGLEASWTSGNPQAQRVDAKIPSVEGKLTIFHEGASWVSATYGCSEFYLRFEGNLASCKGLISGTSSYRLCIDIPRAELTSNVKNYEQNAFSVEEIEFKGLLDLSPNGTSALWVPSLTAGLTL